MAVGASDPVNLDCTVLEVIRLRIEQHPDRNCLDEAQASTPQRVKLMGSR